MLSDEGAEHAMSADWSAAAADVTGASLQATAQCLLDAVAAVGRARAMGTGGDSAVSVPSTAAGDHRAACGATSRRVAQPADHAQACLSREDVAFVQEHFPFWEGLLLRLVRKHCAPRGGHPTPVAERRRVHDSLLLIVRWRKDRLRGYPPQRAGDTGSGQGRKLLCAQCLSGFTRDGFPVYVLHAPRDQAVKRVVGGRGSLAGALEQQLEAWDAIERAKCMRAHSPAYQSRSPVVRHILVYDLGDGVHYPAKWPGIETIRALYREAQWEPPAGTAQLYPGENPRHIGNTVFVDIIEKVVVLNVGTVGKMAWNVLKLLLSSKSRAKYVLVPRAWSLPKQQHYLQEHGIDTRSLPRYLGGQGCDPL